MIVKLLTSKAPNLRQSKVTIKASQFKTVPDDCVVIVKIDGDKDGEIKSTVKLEQAKPSDLTKRAGYKPMTQRGDFALEGKEFYAGAKLHDMLIIPNPCYSAVVRTIGPPLSAATWTKLSSAVQFILDGAAKRIGAEADKTGQELAKMVEEQNGDGADKAMTKLNKVVEAEVGKLQPAIMKALEAQRGKLKSSDPMIERSEYECMALARFTKFLPAPDLQAMLAVYGPSKNDKQMGPLAKRSKQLLQELKDDAGERKTYVTGVGPFLDGLARGGGASDGLAKAEAASKKFFEHLASFKSALESVAEVVEKVGKNAKQEEPKGKEVAKDDKVDWKKVMDKVKRLNDLIAQLATGMINAKGIADNVQAACTAASGKGKLDPNASKLAGALKIIEKDAVDPTTMKNFKKWGENILKYYKE